MRLDEWPDVGLSREVVAENAIADADVALDALRETVWRINRTSGSHDLKPTFEAAIMAVEEAWAKAHDIYNEGNK